MALSAKKIKVYCKLAIISVVVIAVLIFLIQNRKPVSFKFLHLHTRELPLVLFGLSMMGIGALLYRVRRWISKIIREVGQIRREDRVRRELVDEVKKESKGKTNS
jgi:uncharacterized integral membrane protein